MTLDEAIKHCEEVATKNEETIAYYTIQGDKEWLDECEKDCLECASECKQIVEWLKELKEYRKNYTCFNCYNSSASFNDYPCCECRRCFKALDGIKDHYEEVNVDADSN